MEITIEIMAITVLIAEVICAFNLQTIADTIKCNDSAKRETQELAISPM
jgi:histone H3/H4